MARITGLTAIRMMAIEAASIVGGTITSGRLILERFDEAIIDAGIVKGAGQYSVTSAVVNISAIPGSIVGDYFINAHISNRSILGVDAAPGDVIRSTSATAGVFSGNIRGIQGAAGRDGRDGADAAAVVAQLAASGCGIVNHGSTSGTTRPSGYRYIIWVGSVQPTNWVAGDIWVRTA